jgi:uncharacterized membrane protein YoaK (UPF0700 family)
MFKHQGKTRRPEHNIRIASLLSFVAGMVNVVGFLSVQRLTTNVTGHFAVFVDEVFKLDFKQAFYFLLYTFFFFLGSFVSNFMVEIISRRNAKFVYTIPTIVESFILLFVALAGPFLVDSNPDVLAFCLLFAMGLQNSFVTKISNAVVRTTHLTGLFTDLGIELSQLFFYKQKDQRKKLLSSIKLRLLIINFFFVGGVLGGVLYGSMQLHVLIIATVMLLLGLLSNSFKLQYIRLKRKIAKR